MKHLRMTQLLVRCSAICALIGVGIPAYATDSFVIADSYLSSAASASNYGTAVNINIAPTASGLMQFDISKLPSDPSLITKATLVFFVNKVNTSGGVDIKLLASPWAESTVTYASAPSVSGPIAVGGVNVPLLQGQYVTVDITTEVKAWITTPANNFGLILAPASATPTVNATIDSKEMPPPATPLIWLFNW